MMNQSQTISFLILLLMIFSCKPEKENTQNEIDSQTTAKRQTKANQAKGESKYIASALINNQWMFIDENGQQLFDKTFTYASEFIDGVSCVAEDGDRNIFPNTVVGAHYYGMTTAGKKIKAIKSDEPFRFSEGRAFVTQADRKYLIDTKGKVLKFVDGATTALAPSGGVVMVVKDDSLQFWDKDGNVLAENLQVFAGPCRDGLINFEKDGKYGFIDKTGKVLLPAIYDKAGDFSDGFAWVKEKESHYYFINKEFEKKLGPFQDVQDFHEGIAAVKKNGLWSFITKDGSPLFEGQFRVVKDFSEGKAIVQHQDMEVGLVNKKGEFTPLDISVAMEFKNGIVIAEKNARMGHINAQGDWIVAPKYERVSNFSKR